VVASSRRSEKWIGFIVGHDGKGSGESVFCFSGEGRVCFCFSASFISPGGRQSSTHENNEKRREREQNAVIFPPGKVPRGQTSW
jgi:hypothetical protein